MSIYCPPTQPVPPCDGNSLSVVSIDVWPSVVVECKFQNRFPKAEIRRKTGYI